MDSTPPRSCGARLRDLRTATGVSMSALADAANCSYRHLQMIETLDRRPSPELAARIANALTSFAGRTVAVAEFYDGRALPRTAA